MCLRKKHSEIGHESLNSVQSVINECTAGAAQDKKKAPKVKGEPKFWANKVLGVSSQMDGYPFLDVLVFSSQ